MALQQAKDTMQAAKVHQAKVRATKKAAKALLANHERRLASGGRHEDESDVESDEEDEVPPSSVADDYIVVQQATTNNQEGIAASDGDDDGDEATNKPGYKFLSVDKSIRDQFDNGAVVLLSPLARLGAEPGSVVLNMYQLIVPDELHVWEIAQGIVGMPVVVIY